MYLMQADEVVKMKNMLSHKGDCQCKSSSVSRESMIKYVKNLFEYFESKEPIPIELDHHKKYQKYRQYEKAITNIIIDAQTYGFYNNSNYEEIFIKLCEKNHQLKKFINFFKLEPMVPHGILNKNQKNVINYQLILREAYSLDAFSDRLKLKIPGLFSSLYEQKSMSEKLVAFRNEIKTKIIFNFSIAINNVKESWEIPFEVQNLVTQKVWFQNRPIDSFDPIDFELNIDDDYLSDFSRIINHLQHGRIIRHINDYNVNPTYHENFFQMNEPNQMSDPYFIISLTLPAGEQRDDEILVRVVIATHDLYLQGILIDQVNSETNEVVTHFYYFSDSEIQTLGYTTNHNMGISSNYNSFLRDQDLTQAITSFSFVNSIERLSRIIPTQRSFNDFFIDFFRVILLTSESLRFWTLRVGLYHIINNIDSTWETPFFNLQGILEIIRNWANWTTRFFQNIRDEQTNQLTVLKNTKKREDN